jgi:hypothetical protein
MFAEFEDSIMIARRQRDIMRRLGPFFDYKLRGTLAFNSEEEVEITGTIRIEANKH